MYLKRIAMLVLIILLSACAAGPSSTVAPSPPPSETPIPPTATLPPTETPLPPTPTEPPALTPTPAPSETPTTPEATDIPRESGGLDTADGERLFFTIFGEHGPTAIIFSNMSGSTKGEWREAAEFFAEQGFLAVTYDYRGGITNMRENAAQGHVDLTTMYNYVKDELGAQTIFLVGASMGGPITVRAALDLDAAGIVLISAPYSSRSAAISNEELQTITAPIIFINSRNDGFASDTQAMYDSANEPKSLEIFSGDAHGTQLMNTEHAEQLLGALLDFFVENLP